MLFWVDKWSTRRSLSGECHLGLACGLPDALFGVSATLHCFGLACSQQDALKPSRGVPPYAVSG